MTKILIGMLSLALVGTGGLVAAVEGFGGSDPLPSVSLPAASTDSTTTGTTTGTTTDEDISGPCDEAEHANDPRCTGPAAVVDGDDGRNDDDRDDDHSGPGRGGDDDHEDDRDREDNSGRGSYDD